MDRYMELNICINIHAKNAHTLTHMQSHTDIVKHSKQTDTHVYDKVTTTKANNVQMP